MAITPKSPKVGHFLPGANMPGVSGWGSAPEKILGEDPTGAQDRGSSSYVQAGSADIVDERDDSQFAGVTRWTAGRAESEQVALQISNLDVLGDDDRAQLRGLLDQCMPTFHEFINGDVPPEIISDLLLDAEQIIISSEIFRSLRHFWGHDISAGDFVSESELGTYSLPKDKIGAGIARSFGWNVEAFTDLMRMAKVANHERLVVSSGERLPGTTKHMHRLYRMLRLIQGEKVLRDADAFVEMMFAENGTKDRITMKNLVCIYGKAVGEDLEFFDVIEVLLNATWSDEKILVSKKSSQGESLMGTAWYADQGDHMKVWSRGMADTAAKYMHGPRRQVSVAAVNYSLLAEQHLHGVGASEGEYDFYLRELYRKEAHKDLQRDPEVYYDDVDPVWKRSGSGVMNNERALERLREIFAGTDFEDEAAKITDAAGFIGADRPLFRDLGLDTRWVKNVDHYARATLYALLAVARFNQAGEEAMEIDPDFARVSFSLARHMINIYEERSIVLQYLSGPTRDGVLHLIIQTFDMVMFNTLFKRIKRNQRRVTPQKQPPPRGR